MSLFQLALVALVQGITEWLPISSSGHILLLSGLFGVQGENELLINAMAHLGTLFALLVYFWRDVREAIRGGRELLFNSPKNKPRSPAAQLALMITVATPVALTLAVAYTCLPETWVAGLRSLWVVASSTVIFGLLLWWADSRSGQARRQNDMTIRDAILIGATQAVAAILPGTSRSGITMTTARALGFSRVDAARFSMLIGAPLLAASGVYAMAKLIRADAGAITLTLTDGAIVAVLSFASALLSIAALFALLRQMSFLPFVIYRLLLGAALIVASPLGLGLISA